MQRHHGGDAHLAGHLDQAPRELEEVVDVHQIGLDAREIGGKAGLDAAVAKARQRLARQIPTSRRHVRIHAVHRQAQIRILFFVKARLWMPFLATVDRDLMPLGQRARQLCSIDLGAGAMSRQEPVYHLDQTHPYPSSSASCLRAENRRRATFSY